LNKIKIFLFIAIIMVATAIAGCINTDLKTSISISLSSQDVQSTKLDGDEKIQAIASCTGDHECTVNSVTISWTDSVSGQSHSKTFQLKKTVSKNSSLTFDVVLIDNSDREYSPFSYLRSSNPTNANTGYTSYSESIAQPTFGSNVTTPAVNPLCTSSVTSIAVYDTSIPPVLIRTDSCTQFNLTPVTDYVRGTLKVTDYTQSVQETGSFGNLSGDGTGYLLSTWYVKFNSGVDGTMGSLFVFYQKKSVGSGTSDLELSNSPLGNDLKLVYGSTTLTQSGTSLVDSTGIIYGYISGKNITLSRPLGYSDSDIVATYTSEPFVSIGGEVLGYGDGVNKTYSFRTKYAPLYDGSLTVFTSAGAAQTVSSNKYTGDVTAVFSSAVPLNTPIKASYRTSSTGRMAFTVKFDTDKGQFSFPVYLQVNGS
jgi:hypothetical protein